MTATRREFIAGLGAALVMARLPSASNLALGVRQLPRIARTIPTEWYFTADYLRRTLEDLGRQVGALAPLRLTPAERTLVAEMIDDALWQIKPAGLAIQVEASLEKLARGEFEFAELPYGIVRIT